MDTFQLCMLGLGLAGLIMIYIAYRKLFPGDVEYLTIDGKTYTIKMDKCHCGARKAACDPECYHHMRVDLCECGEEKAKEQSFCSRCRLELHGGGRIRRKPLLPY
jgi:hypothetical protein